MCNYLLFIYYYLSIITIIKILQMNSCNDINTGKNR